MANDLNQCNFIGRLGNDPEIRYLPEGGAVAKISIACGWKSKDKEGVEWITVIAYQKLAEIIGEYLQKGSKVFVSGRFKTRKWQDQQGVERYTTEIVCNELQMLDGKQDGAAPAQARQAPAQQPVAQRPAPQASPQPQQGYQPMIGKPPAQNQPLNPAIDFDEDIPF